MTIDRARAAALVQHETDTLADLSIGYPANHFAWRVILASAKERGATSLVEIGVGGGNGVPHVLAAGLDFAGIDHNPAMVETTRTILADLGDSAGEETFRKEIAWREFYADGQQWFAR